MKLGWVILYVEDVAETLAFYERCFGVKTALQVEGVYGEVDSGSTTLAFAHEGYVAGQGVEFRELSPSEPPPGAQVTFVADNVPEAFATAVAAGATPVIAPHRAPQQQDVSFVRDLNGFLVEIASSVGAPTNIG